MIYTLRARGCVNHIETDTECYKQLVPWSCTDKMIIMVLYISKLKGCKDLVNNLYIGE